MKKSRKIVFLLTSVLLSKNIMAFNHHEGKGIDKGKPTASGGQNKSGCAPSTAKLRIEFNDVRAIIETGGILFYDRANGVAGYEVPKSNEVGKTNPTSIYSGALWMGGKDVNGQLKLAAQLFRATGVDFWTGPLTVTPGTGNYDPKYPVGDNVRRDFGEANIGSDQCLAYDKFFTIKKAEVIQFNVWWECENEPGTEGCDDIVEPTAETMNRINTWPAHGDATLGQDFFLAPFYDNDENGVYDPTAGDHPWFDDILGRDDITCGSDRRISLFGDETNWWVFNDKGNIHTETSGDPIGMEIRAQAFSFTTDDEINRMTFYNYEMINRGTQTLEETYFSQFVDTDLGGYNDDYVGCDVTRGLGYCFNGDAQDETSAGKLGFGEDPPAIGIDFFEGPYQDADGVDNPGPKEVVINGVTTTVIPTVSDAINQKGIVYKGLGIGYGDEIIDNERFGMKGFTYFTGQGAPANQSDPDNAAQYYNYMSGLWKFGDLVVYGGTGFPGSPGATTTPSRYCFPDDSDTLNWGTEGVDLQFDWSEETNNNPVGDRRFVQSAGPFTLKPGAVNNITVGIVYARSYDGDLYASVRALKRADTKAQALFDNCFKIFDPPSAPKLTIQELNNELVLMLDNPSSSNNYEEGYLEEDKINIIDPGNGVIYDKFYKFEGYQIFQMKDGSASGADITDITKARLVAQCDIKNSVSKLVNFEFDDDLGFSIPKEKVDGENKGIRHTFSITEDQFAQGERTLVNHKTYYYIAVAYGYNNYLEYDPNDAGKLDGQKRPYVSSRNNFDGGSIIVTDAIPHNPMPELGGTNQLLDYGMSPEVTRLDGRGNGSNAIDLTQASIDFILSQGTMDNPTYNQGAGPLNVKVIDPLNLVSGYFECKFTDYVSAISQTNLFENKNYDGTDTANWVVYRYDKEGGTLLDSMTSDRTITVSNEQLIPEWGISVQIFQDEYFFPSGSGPEYQRYTSPIEATIEFADSSKPWLAAIQDDDAFYPTNWILSGDYEPQPADTNSGLGISNPGLYGDEIGKDKDKSYAKLLDGGIAPYRLVNYRPAFSPLAYPEAFNSANTSRTNSSISRAPSVDIVFTTDKSKWTHCAVIELGRNKFLNLGGAEAGTLRQSLSVDKNGNEDGSGTKGLGWFPGYAIDLETGKRLHMAFGENSFLGGDNGGDMIWNPTERMFDNAGNPIFGGQHAIYVFGYNITGNLDNTRNCPYYDGVEIWPYDKLKTATNNSYTDVYSNLVWIANPILQAGQSVLSNDVKIRVRINKEYNDYIATGRNAGKPMYSWTLDNVATQTSNVDKLKEALDLINVVPNPYYAFSEYERSRIDTRVKITNLPDVCTIKIYNISGKLIRTFKKDSPVTSIDWDMKNMKQVPIASGVYLIHVEVPGAGERILKFFGGVRQIDLENI